MKKPVVTVYSRPGCHLCDVAKSVIESSALRDSFVLEEINIDTEETLKARYGYDIPVVLIDGIKVFKHSVDIRSFEHKLKRFKLA